jgi:hypothetical protein
MNDLDEQMERWCEANEQIQRRVAERIGRHQEVEVRYAAYQDDAEGLPIDNLDKVAYRGFVRFRDEGSDYWAWRSVPWESAVLEDPTWLDLCAVANDKILRGGDRHHVFLEGISLGEIVAGVMQAEFRMGS